jgi:hypothetical protein
MVTYARTLHERINKSLQQLKAGRLNWCRWMSQNLLLQPDQQQALILKPPAVMTPSPCRIQQVAELDRVSRLTDEELELKSLLDQDEVEEFVSPSIDDILVDIFDELDAEDFNATKAELQRAVSEKDAALLEADREEGNLGQDNETVGAAATGQKEGSTTPDRGPAGKDAETSGAEATASQELTPLSEVPQNQALPQQDADRAAADPRTALPSIL